MVVRHSRGHYEVSLAAGPPELPADWPVITDSNLADLYPQLTGPAAFVIPAGEASKSLHSAGEILDWLAQRGIRRNQGLVALGGGVVGDLAGFVASVYLRGIPFLQIPTSLLAMVDSSVGGKVGVDLPSGKNLAGSFWPPAQVLIHPDFLHTLPEPERKNGLAEIAKMGAIRDAALLDQLKPDQVSLEQIEASVRHKRDVVEADEFETNGIRATLNFGHTIGHAIEQVTQYAVPHGQAVAMGMAAEAQLGTQLGITPPATTEWLIGHLERLGLPTTIPPQAQDTAALLHAMRRDKKVTGANLAFALLTAPGACKLFAEIPGAAVEELFNSKS